MMCVIAELLDVFATYIELLLSIVVGFCFLEKKRALRELYKQIVLLPLIPLVGVTVIDFFFGRYSYARMCYSFVSIFLLLLWVYRNKWYRCLAVTMAYCGMFIMADTFVTALVSDKINMPIAQIIVDHSEIYLVCLLMAKMLLIVLSECVLQLKWKSLFNSRKYWNLYLLITSGIFLMMIWATFAILHYQDNKPLAHMGIALFTFSIVFMIFLEISISRISMQEQDELEIQLLSSYNESLAREIETQEYRADNERKLRHDFKNIVIGMQACVSRGATEELQVIMDQLMTVIKSNRGISLPNKKLEELLNQKIYEADQKNISVSLNIDFPDKTKISMFDICVMLGNLLDNAIENAKDAREPSINIVIKKVKTYYIIRISNTYLVKPQRETGIFKTRKSGLNHGLGMKSAKDVVVRLGGSFRADYDEHFFYAEILLPESEVLPEEL